MVFVENYNYKSFSCKVINSMKDKLNVPQFNVLDFSYGMKSWLQKELQDNI